MINFEWYRTFKAVYQAGTLTGAAQELMISQPAASVHLAALENYLGHKLFERGARRMTPTDFGKQFYTQIIEPVERLEGIETDYRFAALSKLPPLISIGAPLEIFYAVMAQRTGKANASLAFEFGLTKDLMQKLAKDRLQFVVATHRMEEQGVVYEPVIRENFFLVGHPGINTAVFDKHLQRGALEAAEQWLAGQPWFAYSSDLAVIRRFWLRNFRKRPPLKPRYIVPDMTAIFRAISAEKGLTVAAEFLVKDLLRAKQLKIIWKGNTPTTNTIYLAYYRKRVNAAQIATARALFKK